MRNLMNQGIALALTVGMGAGMILSADAATYRDIDWHWAKKDIETLSEKNIFEGYGDGTFRPDQYITRAEFVSVLMKALGIDRGAGSYGGKYNDVQGHWAAGLIGQADSKNLVQGYPNNEFRPSERITRAEALAILSKVTMGPNPDNEKIEQILKNYRDGYRVPGWSRESIAKAIHYDVFRSASTRANWVSPNEPLRRGEVASLLSNLIRHNELARNPEIEIYHKWNKVVPDQAIRFPQGIDNQRTKSTYTATVATPISSEFNTAGDKITLILNEKVVTPNGVTLAPGSKILGVVREVRPASYTESAMMAIDFDKVMTPEGRTYEVKGTIASSDGYLHGNSNLATTTQNSSYEALKAQIKSESGAQTRNQKQEVLYKNNFGVETSMNRILDENKTNFVLVGVGDKLELNFSGAANIR